MVEIAVHTPLIAPVSDVEMNTQGHTHAERLLIHLNQEAHTASGKLLTLEMGWSETRRIPCLERSSTNCSASLAARAGSTSNSEQIRSETICDNAVWPSAACQIMVATSFNE